MAKLSENVLDGKYNRFHIQCFAGVSIFLRSFPVTPVVGLSFQPLVQCWHLPCQCPSFAVIMKHRPKK